MKRTLTFTTNINCGGCVMSVTPALNKLAGEHNWTVDTSKPEKQLSVDAAHLQAEEVIRAVQAAGFKIEILPQ